MMEINTLEEYASLLKRGRDALRDTRYSMAHGLRRDIQKQRFGGNNAEGNTKFYRYCLSSFPMVCEHCGKPIRHPSAYNVSHILSRGSHPEMAHDPRNINILCPECHDAWEHTTTRGRMNPWFVAKNEKRIEQLKQEYNEE